MATKITESHSIVSRKPPNGFLTASLNEIAARLDNFVYHSADPPEPIRVAPRRDIPLGIGMSVDEVVRRLSK